MPIFCQDIIRREEFVRRKLSAVMLGVMYFALGVLSTRSTKHTFENWGLAVPEKSRKKVIRMGLPGVELVGAPRRSLLHMVRASQLPYNEKSKKRPNESIKKKYRLFTISL